MDALVFKDAAATTAKTIVTIEEGEQVEKIQGQCCEDLMTMLEEEEEESGVEQGVGAGLEWWKDKRGNEMECDGGWEPLVSVACRHCVGMCFLGLVAMASVQYLFLGALEGSGGGSSISSRTWSCGGRGGVNLVGWVVGIVGGGVMVCGGGAWVVVCWRGRRRSGMCLSCQDDMELSRSMAEDADKRAQKAQRSKQEFMAYVFHNIRVPFNAIVLGLGYLRATEDEKVSSTDVKEKMDLVKLMLDCAETMTNVLNDVTDLDQDEGGTMELHMEEFDLLAVLKFLVWGMKDLISHKNICFKMDIKPMVESLLRAYHVVGDKHRVVQTLGIFLSNAVKFTPCGGTLELKVKCKEVVEGLSNNSWHQPCLRAAVSSQILQHPPIYAGVKYKVVNLVLKVKDFATGMSSQDHSKLFEPYSCFPKCGLSASGLSMAKRFSEQAGGYIGLKSINGKDRAFCLSIPYLLVPVDKHAESDIKAKDVHNPDATDCNPVCIIQDGLDSSSQRGRSIKLKNACPTQDSGSRRRVLLVEDTEINRIILRKVLQNLNLHCEEAENGKIAVDYFKQGRTYDLVLMDKEMPVMDGHEATRQLRTMGVKTPIIALTGNALQSDKDLFFEAGVDDFQTKPLSRDKLVQLLARYGVESSRADNIRG